MIPIKCAGSTWAKERVSSLYLVFELYWVRKSDG